MTADLTAGSGSLGLSDEHQEKTMRPCPVCLGRGQLFGTACRVCNGTGELRDDPPPKKKPTSPG